MQRHCLKNVLKIGQDLMDVPKTLYKNHRDLLIKNMKEQIKPQEKSIILLPGVPTIPIDDQDIEIWVEQESNFFYLFGVEQPDCYAAIELDTGKTTLFPTKIPDSYRMWMLVPDDKWFLEEYQVDNVVYFEHLAEYLKQINPSTIYLYDGIDSDSGLRPRLPDLKLIDGYRSNTTDLYEILNEQRTVKDDIELDIMRHVTRISSDAHINVMENVKPGLRQVQMEALFRFYCCERLGSKHIAYHCTCASGEGNSTLHYHENDNILQESELILNDMGTKYQGYCSDITCSFPSNGKFTQKQKEIYEAVLDANYSVQKALKAGVAWDDMHRISEYRILEHLQKLGLVVPNFPIQEMVDNRVGAVFLPHGLGHFIGLRVHDVGGYNKGCPERHAEPGLKNLRTRRVLKANQVITIEPGCYFNDFILDNALQDEKLAKYLVKEKIDEYRVVGGVRIEDDVIVHEDRCENMTIVPRTVEEIENCMAGKPWRSA